MKYNINIIYVNINMLTAQINTLLLYFLLKKKKYVNYDSLPMSDELYAYTLYF